VNKLKSLPKTIQIYVSEIAISMRQGYFRHHVISCFSAIKHKKQPENAEKVLYYTWKHLII